MEKQVFGTIDDVVMFGMLNGDGGRNLKDADDGEGFEVAAAAIITPDDEGKKPTLFLVTPGGDPVITQSDTAIKTFISAVEFFGTHRLQLAKTSGTSKAGRKFVNLKVTGVIR